MVKYEIQTILKKAVKDLISNCFPQSGCLKNVIKSFESIISTGDPKLIFQIDKIKEMQLTNCISLIELIE